jgi:hypothetical protein
MARPQMPPGIGLEIACLSKDQVKQALMDELAAPRPLGSHEDSDGPQRRRCEQRVLVVKPPWTARMRRAGHIGRDSGVTDT